MENALKREDWDFSGLEVDDLISALLWETRREHPDIDEVVTTAQAWLEGRLSTRRPPMPRDKRTGRRQRYNYKLSEADKARILTLAVFGDFVPLHNFSFLAKWSLSQRRLEWDRWLPEYLLPLLKNHDVPWLCLPAEERQWLCDINQQNRNASVVNVGSWWDAVGNYEKLRPDRGLALKFDHFESTTFLLTVNWSHSKKRILAAFAQLLEQLQPIDMTRIKRWDRRGKKDRDLLVMLERIAIMRLLHHYTLSELRLRLREAWEHYAHRKWYDERRHALQNFRDVFGRREADFFPRSWLTKAGRSRKITELPAK